MGPARDGSTGPDVVPIGPLSGRPEMEGTADPSIGPGGTGIWETAVWEPAILDIGGTGTWGLVRFEAVGTGTLARSFPDGPVGMTGPWGVGSLCPLGTTGMTGGCSGLCSSVEAMIISRLSV